MNKHLMPLRFEMCGIEFDKFEDGHVTANIKMRFNAENYNV